MIRVAVAAPARERCGVSDYARLLREALPDRFEVTAIDFPENASAADWRRAATRADAADLVHAHYEYGLFEVVKPYRNRLKSFLSRLRPPVVVSLHDVLPSLAPRWGQQSPYRLRDAVRDLAYLPFCGRWERAQYELAELWLAHTRGHEGKVWSAIGPARVARFVHPVPETAASWRPAEDPVRLVTPGFLKGHKGYPKLLPALEKLPEVIWTIAGGPQDERDREFARTFGAELERNRLAERVPVTGYLSRGDLEQTVVAAHLAVFPFDRITGSGSVTWAIALGMPIAATDLDGVVEMVEDGAGIELLPHADPGSWPDHLAGLLASPDRLEALAAENRAYAQRHSYARAGERLGELFDRVLEGR